MFTCLIHVLCRYFREAQCSSALTVGSKGICVPWQFHFIWLCTSGFVYNHLTYNALSVNRVLLKIN